MRCLPACVDFLVKGYRLAMLGMRGRNDLNVRLEVRIPERLTAE